MSPLVFLFCATFFSVVAPAFSQDAASLPNETPAVSESLDYQVPDVSKQVGASYSATKEITQISLQTGADVSRWRSQIGVDDPVLARLTREAVSNNLTLHEALFNVQAARAALNKEVQKLERLPSTATSTERELAERRCEAAEAELELQRWLYRGAYVDLVADVAETYVGARSLQEQIRATKINILTQSLAVNAVKDQVEAGGAGKLDLSRALGSLRDAEAPLYTFETRHQQARNRLCVLVGRPTVDDYVDAQIVDDRALPTLEELGRLTLSAPDKFGAVARNLLEESFVPKTPDDLLVGIPADLLRRRPDVRAAEQRVVAQNARRAIATLEARLAAEKSPNDATTASETSEVDADFDVEAARFAQEAATAKYRALILEAQREVDDALAQYDGESQKIFKLQNALASALDEFETTLRTRRNGAPGPQSSLDALFAAQTRLGTLRLPIVESETQRALAIVALYRALGGDWDAPSTESVEEAAPENGSEAESK